jgi:hydrogenase expression/formation protein HypC
VSCHGDHCVTCSDEGLLVRVAEVRGDGTAVCDDGAEVMTDLVGAVDLGETLLVHAGVALAKVEQ